MTKKYLVAIILLLTIGIGYRLLLTHGGNFIFNIDNARDMVDVREMVVLQKPRLIGPTSAIEGIYGGPSWYYLLAIPFIISGGDAYSEIILQIVFWAIGGFFLLKLVSRYGMIAFLASGLLWVFSNFIVLANLYAFNPNPVTLLTPLFIYLLEKYILTGKLFYSLALWLMASLFFHLEMNFGIFMPVIIILTALITKRGLLKTPRFFAGVAVFMFMLLPQIIFELRHQFMMSNSLIRYLSQPHQGITGLLPRFNLISKTFYNVLTPTLINSQLMTTGWLILLIFSVIKLISNFKRKDFLFPLILLLFIFIPFLGYIFIPVTVNSWHLGGIAATAIIMCAYFLGQVNSLKNIGWLLAAILLLGPVYYSYLNVADTAKTYGQPSRDVSVYKNELAAIDYIYAKAAGKNFRVYTYLPSVIDYPYQYLFWWYGLKKYGYTPKDYAYLPNQPNYISNYDKFIKINNSPDLGLLFLIKEPDRIGIRHLWENSFSKNQLILSEKVGPLIVETRKE